MYIYNRRFSGAQSLPQEQPVTSRPAPRNSYCPDRVQPVFGSSSSYVWTNGGLGQSSTAIRLRPHLSDAEERVEQRKGTQVLYVRPTPPKPRMIRKIEYQWSFDTAEGRREYEAALHKHLQNQKIVSGDTVYEPLSSSADIATLAHKKFANLVLIVHGAHNGPAIGVDLGSSAAGTKPDWIKADKFAKLIAPFGYTNITVLGCDSVSNKFTPNLAKLLPKGSTVTGHKGGDFEITRHFAPNKKVPGQLQLTRVSSNLQLKAFKTEGKSL
ncbi:MAG TPA: hypothetical protein VNP04_31690 [Alphaproteobacteria bacterium]|nr:hypothetical protein [Alphaproteobacteria bacterium]